MRTSIRLPCATSARRSRASSSASRTAASAASSATSRCTTRHPWRRPTRATPSLALRWRWLATRAGLPRGGRAPRLRLRSRCRSRLRRRSRCQRCRCRRWCQKCRRSQRRWVVWRTLSTRATCSIWRRSSGCSTSPWGASARRKDSRRGRSRARRKTFSSSPPITRTSRARMASFLTFSPIPSFEQQKLDIERENADERRPPRAQR
mmetsp:Transcript_25983/g.85453  ORF Transcript_25983/g.85453 Transcript_25983/m.85453 type:complete len:206 (+) Transcript_25983:148-765(+)